MIDYLITSVALLSLTLLLKQDLYSSMQNDTMFNNTDNNKTTCNR